MKRWVVHPFLVAAAPIVALYSQNVGYTRPGELFLPLLFSTAVTGIGLLVLWVLMRDLAKAGAGASLFAFLFFTYAPLRDLFFGRFGAADSIKNQIFLPSIAVVGLLLLVAVWRSRRDFEPSIGFLNVVALCLVFVPSATAVTRAVAGSTPPIGSSGGIVALESETRPDIYHIIVDGFGRPDVLREQIGLDLGGFVERMEQRGFFIADRSVTNYGFTLASISSTLGMEYHTELVERMGTESEDWQPYLRVLGRNRVARSLQEHGYTFVSFASGWVGTEEMQPDVFLQGSSGLTEFQQQVLRMTPVMAMATVLIRDWVYGLRRERILYTFRTLPDLAEDTRPTYALAHIMAPHQPFVFDAAGGRPDSKGGLALIGDGSISNPEEYLRLYGAQAEFISRKLEEVVDAILTRSPEPPIIIIHGDHGPSSKLAGFGIAPQVRMPILNCYYLPGEGATELHDAITPVNSFRLVLRHYFGGDLEPLPDLGYMTKSGRPFDLRRVIPEGEEERAPHR